MVLFVDYDEDGEPPDHGHFRPEPSSREHRDWRTDFAESAPVKEKEEVERPNLNKNAMTAALACYPVISQIASAIDLNTLDNLSRTCRQVHENLLQYRKQLIRQTLKCCNEDVTPNKEHTLRYRARASDWYFVEEGGANAIGKVGPCARDMVSECRRCITVVCRNCTIKPPAPILLKERHRRLCRTCIKAPLPALVSPHLDPKMSIKDPAVAPQICACEESVWLCQPCGRNLRSADSTYASIWRWRTAYGPSLGGLGTGIGEGNRGVGCGREHECLAAHEVEEEIDCDAADARVINDGLAESPPARGGTPSTPDWNEPGYARHEIEGIGGLLKKKLVRMVRVGACVVEFEEETRLGKPLMMERKGACRSWCGWCWRVIPGEKDRVEA